MSYTTAALTTLAVLCLINIALTLGVIRRLAALAQAPGSGGGGCGGDGPPIGLAPGATVGDFSVTTVNGEPVSRAGLRGSTLVGFLAPGCPSCEDSVPAFIARAESAHGGRDHVLAVVLGDPEVGSWLHGRLAPVARVVAEQEERGPLARAFAVDSLPAFAVLSGSTVVATHALPERLPGSVPETAPA